MYGGQRTADDTQRKTVVFTPAPDIRPHCVKGIHDPFHGAASERCIAVKFGNELLTRENSRDQAGGSTAVPCVQYLPGRIQSPEAFSVY